MVFKGIEVLASQLWRKLKCISRAIVFNSKYEFGIHDSLEKTLMLGGVRGRRRRGQERTRWLDGISSCTSMYMSLSKLQKMVKDRKGWRAAVHEVTKSQTQLSD